MPNQQENLVVFDLGGVVVRICRSWPEACARAGLPAPSPAAFADPILSAKRRALSEAYQRGQLTCEQFFPRLAETTGGLYSADDVRLVHHVWTLDEYPGVHELVCSLKAAGVRTGVLSNTNHAHWVRLAPPMHEEAKEYPTPRLADDLHASHLMGLAKPDEAIYREFVKRARTAGWRGQENQIVFFDDLAENVETARACGWRAVQVDHTGDTAAQMRAALVDLGILTARGAARE